MDKKTKMALAVIRKLYVTFPEIRLFIDKAYIEECCKENISVDKVFLSLILVVSVSLLCYASLCFILNYTVFNFFFHKFKKVRKSKQETRNATRCNDHDNLLHLSFTLKISTFSEAYIYIYITQSNT